jgi:hypothetical protein
MSCWSTSYTSFRVAWARAARWDGFEEQSVVVVVVFSQGDGQSVQRGDFGVEPSLLD